MSNPAQVDDRELLRRYAGDREEAAFAELVQRHLRLVYACALRRVGGDAHLAQDVAQQVFSALARQAAALSRHAVLAGWLYTTTRYTAAQVVRAERRRQRREQEVRLMNEASPDQTAAAEWERLRPVLDDTLDELDERDRVAVMLRFFEERSFAEIGERLRLTENAARMRVDRALDKLHALLAQRGVTSTTAALGIALAGQVAGAMPAGLATAVTSAALTSGAAASGAAIATFMGMTKLQLGTAAIVAVASVTGFQVQDHARTRVRDETARLGEQQQQLANVPQDHARMTALAAEIADLRRDDAEFARLRQEAENLQRAMRDRAQAIAATPTSRVPVDPSGLTYDIGALEKQPAAKSQTPPKYPPEFRAAGVGGEVVVDFVVDADGLVQNARAIRSSNAAFEAPAVEAIRQWRFEPGLKAGQRVRTHLQVPIVFTLSKEKITTEQWF